MKSPTAQAIRTSRIYLVYAGSGRFVEEAQQADSARLNPERDMGDAPKGAIAVRYTSEHYIVFDDAARTNPRLQEEEDVFKTFWFFFCPRVTILDYARVICMPERDEEQRDRKREALSLVDEHDCKRREHDCAHVVMFTAEGGNKHFYRFHWGEDDIVDFTFEDAD